MTNPTKTETTPHLYNHMRCPTCGALVEVKWRAKQSWLASHKFGRLRCVGSGMMIHSSDVDCTVVDGVCTVCKVCHGDPCHECGGRGFHVDGCKEIG